MTARIASARIASAALRTPLGASAAEVVDALFAGRRAARPNPRFDASTYVCKVAAPVPGDPPASRDARFLKRMARFGLVVAREAMRGAGDEMDRGGMGGREAGAFPRYEGTLRGPRRSPPICDGDRVGLFSAVGGLRAHWDDLMPALEQQELDGSRPWERGLRRIHPFWMLSHLSNNAHAIASAELGLRGEGATFGGATAGAQALAAAARALAAGAIDAALVVAYDSLLEPETLVELGARHGEGGIAPGEAAAAVWLTREGRGARVQARAIADGAPGAPCAETIATAAAAVGSGAGVVDGASRGGPWLDDEERAALGPIVGEACPLIASAASLGALGAATPVVQAILLAEILRRGDLPPIAGLAAPSPGPLRPLVEREPAAATTALAISGGPPGLAAAVRVELSPMGGSS